MLDPGKTIRKAELQRVTKYLPLIDVGYEPPRSQSPALNNLHLFVLQHQSEVERSRREGVEQAFREAGAQSNRNARRCRYSYVLRLDRRTAISLCACTARPACRVNKGSASDVCGAASRRPRESQTAPLQAELWLAHVRVGCNVKFIRSRNAAPGTADVLKPVIRARSTCWHVGVDAVGLHGTLAGGGRGRVIGGGALVVDGHGLRFGGPRPAGKRNI
jgi:hypothetical protein